MLLARFVTGLSDEIGRQVRFRNPENLHQAVPTAFAVREAVKQEMFAQTFYIKFDKSVSVSSQGGSSEAEERYSTKRATSLE
jgi:hypothetical protein